MIHESDGNETVFIEKTINGYSLTVQHEDSGSAFGVELSNAQMKLLKELIKRVKVETLK
jgi:pyruvate dehydrogenase complex dehydrogenase (E1) component